MEGKAGKRDEKQRVEDSTRTSESLENQSILIEKSEVIQDVGSLETQVAYGAPFLFANLLPYSSSPHQPAYHLLPSHHTPQEPQALEMAS